MAVKVEFQPSSKIIQVTQAPVLIDGEWVIELDVKIDLFSDGKEDWTTDADLNKFRFPFESVGGNPLPGSKELGATFFLANGWKIRPYEADHVFRVNGNMYRPDGVSPYTSTIGSYNVLLESTVSSLVDSTVQQLAEIEYISFGGGVSLDITATHEHATGVNYPSGNQEYSSNNLTDTIAIAGTKFDTIFINSSMIGADKLDGGNDVSGFTLIGKSDVNTEIEIDAALVCDNLALQNFNIISAVLDGGTHIRGCSVGILSYMDGHIEECGMYGKVTLDGTKNAVLRNCYSIDQDYTLEVDMGGSGQSLAMPGYIGKVTVSNLDDLDAEIGIALNGGIVILEDTIVNASIVMVSGVGLLIDNTPDTVEVNSDGLVNVQNITTAASLAYTDKIYIHLSEGTAGTDAPQGTEKFPVNTLADALIIAAREQKSILDVTGALIILSGQDVSGYTVFAARSLNNSVVVNSGAITVGTYFENLTVIGTMNGAVRYTTCVLGLIYNFDGGAKNCLLTNDIHFTGTGNNYLTECDTYVTTSAYISLYQNDASLNIIRGRGRYGIFDKTSTDYTAIDLVSGFVYVDISCNVGEIHVGGIGSVEDNSGVGCIVKQGALNNEYIGKAAAEYDLTGYIAHATVAGIQVRVAYNDIVEIDILGGSSGTTFPMGMPGHEVNNFADAKTIMETYHLSKMRVNDDIVIPASSNLNGITFISGKTIDRTITIPATATTNGAKFRDVILIGTLNGRVELSKCQTEDLYNFSGIMTETGVAGALSLDDSTGQLTTLYACRTGGDGSIPDLHINGTKVSIVEWTGSLNVNDKTGSSVLGISTLAGNFSVKATCTAGMIIFAGVGTVDKEVGTTSIVIDSHLLNKENIAKEVLDSVA